MGLNSLYEQDGYRPHFHNAENEPVAVSFSFDNDVLKAAMKRLYEKKYNPLTEIDEGLFNEFWDIYNQGTDEGFGSFAPPLEGTGEADFLDEIRHNNGVFAAFKTHRFQNDMAAMLLDENGKLKPFASWERDTASIRDHHVKHWLETEYNTAVRRAHLAAEWRQFEREKDILPNLEWMKTTAVTPGKDHEPFWGVILSIDSPFWNDHRPGDRWGCKCGLRNTDAPERPPKKTDWDNPVYAPAKGLDNNPGKDAMMFSFSHPYFAAAYLAYKKLRPIVDKFVNKQLTKRVNKRLSKIKAEIDRFDGKLITGGNFKNGEIIVLRRSLDDIKEHSLSDPRVKVWLMSFNMSKLKDWKYIGWDYPKPYNPKHPKYNPEDPLKSRHPEAEYFLYYELAIAGKKYYANVKMHVRYGKEVLYTIEKEKPTKLRKGEPGKE